MGKLMGNQEGIRNAKYGRFVTGSPALYYEEPNAWLETALSLTFRIT